MQINIDCVACSGNSQDTRDLPPGCLCGLPTGGTALRAGQGGHHRCPPPQGRLGLWAWFSFRSYLHWSSYEKKQRTGERNSVSHSLFSRYKNTDKMRAQQAADGSKTGVLRSRYCIWKYVSTLRRKLLGSFALSCLHCIRMLQARQNFTSKYPLNSQAVAQTAHHYHMKLCCRVANGPREEWAKKMRKCYL